MADLPEIGIQPQAHPVDEFVRPAAQRSVRGGDLLQLAGALKEFSAAGNEIYQRRADAYREGSAQAADQVSEAKQYQNMQALNGAVAEGKIPMWANPWFQVRLEQDTARNEVQLASKGIENDLAQSELMHNDDPNLVHKFISDRFGSLMQGRNAFQVSAMAPEINKARQQMMGDWLQTRGADRIREAHQATGTLVMQKLDGFDSVGYARGDPDATKSVDVMTADIQQQYNHLTNVVDKATASKWISDAVLEAAKTHRNADLARVLLDNIKGQDGIKLSITGDNRFALQRLPREIAELQNGDLSAEITTKQLLGVKERQNLMEAAQGMMKDQGVANLWQVKLSPEQWQKLSPEGYAEATKALAALSQEALAHKNVLDQYDAEPIIKDLLTKSVNGQLKMPDQVSLMSALAAHGEPGRNYLETFARFLHYQRDMKWGDTTAGTLQDLNSKAVSGTLTMNDIMAHAEHGDIDQHTAADFMSMAANIESAGGVNGRHSAMVGQAIIDLHNLVQAPYLQDGLLGRGDTADADKMRLSEGKAETAFLKEFHNKLVRSPDWDKKSFVEQQKMVEELRDSVAKNFGGQTMQEFLKERPKALERPTPLNRGGPTQTTTASQPKEVDPFVHSMNDGMVNDLSRMLNTDVKKLPLHEMVKWSDKNPDPLGTGPQGQHIDDGQAMLDRVAEYGSRINMPVDAPLDMEKGTLGGSRTSYLVAEKQGQAFQLAQQKMDSLRPYAEQSITRLTQLRDKFNASGQLSFEDQQEARQQLLRFLAFQDLRTKLGYTPAEVKGMGDGAWRSAPMFANPVDLKQRGEAIAAQLGLKDFQYSAFIHAQLDLMQQLHPTPEK